MGDIAPPADAGSDYANPEMPKNPRRGIKSDDGSSTNPQSTSPTGTAASQGQYQQFYAPPSNPFSSQLEMPLARGSNRQGPYDMSVMTNALPQSGYRPGYSNTQHQQRYTPASPNVIPQMVHFPGQPQMLQLANQQYYLPQHQQVQPYFNTQVSPSSQHQQHQLGSLRGGMNIGYYTNSAITNQPQVLGPGYYYSPSNQFSAQHPTIQNHLGQSQYFVPDGSSGGPRESPPLQRSSHTNGLGGFLPGKEMTGNQPSIVRGPPRKPRQSGHAIWIGNLPPQTELMSLVYHICRETTRLQSLFLISKSNCAFANFKDEASCVTAQQKLHDSKFQSVRLVSRLRKSTVEGTSGQTAPTGPSAISSGAQSVSSDPTPLSPSSTDSPSTHEAGTGVKSPPVANGAQQKDKFFILKSLTVEDLELSVQNGVWATQSHNEEALNEAFGVSEQKQNTPERSLAKSVYKQAADNVYLIFSANKSGEYFGYARMASPINHDPAAAIEFAPKAQAANNMDLPKTIPTQATETCPRGRIIDDSARGTIFWEVEQDEADGVLSDTVSEDSESARSMHDGEGEPKAWGKPFKLEWLSTIRLPFYKTRGLRNPWNSNREVKIARDGTELEPTVGRKLIGLFARVQSPVPASTMGMMGIATGYTPQAPTHFH
ncbi:YT521-B-like domain-containing protein [Xylaria digitata]|nr:YT521-B-like domain-containing protein [Xylaria digitata]